MTDPFDGKVVSEAIGLSPDRGLVADMLAGASPPSSARWLPTATVAGTTGRLAG